MQPNDNPIIRWRSERKTPASDHDAGVTQNIIYLADHPQINIYPI